VPDLPTLNVTASQAERLLAVFGSPDAYKAWLRDALKSHVIEQEQHRVDRKAQEARDAEVQQISIDLFGPDPVPPVIGGPK
jgi:hypothetical protein